MTEAAKQPAIDPKKIAAIDEFLADGERDKGYRAFVMMRQIWPQLRDLALAPQQPDETAYSLPFHEETMAGLDALTIRTPSNLLKSEQQQMTTKAEVDTWRAEHLRLSAKRLDTYIARVQAHAAEYRAIADRLDPCSPLTSKEAK